MKLSKLFTKTYKEESSKDTSKNAVLLEKAGFVSKEMAGVYTYLPLGLKVLKKIEKVVREKMDSLEANEVLMPGLTSIENYKKTGRDHIDVLFYTKLHDGKDFVLNQSHEEVVTPLAKKYANSYKDFPLAIYQIQTKFRNEPRAKSGLLRLREFVMKDLYSFHTDEKDLDNYYEKVQKAYFEIFKAFGLEDKTYLVYASGGTFSKYSHEFQVECLAGEDEVHLCSKCKVGINKEIIEEQKVCPVCGSKDLKIVKTIEVGNIFKLKEKFSKSFDFNYTGSDGKQDLVTMGCYGLGITRVFGTVAEVFADDKGLVWPEIVAPYKYHIVDLTGEEENIKKVTDKLGEENCLIDDRDISAGAKFADADLMGMPVRIVISKKTLENDSVEVKKRNNQEAKLVKINQL